VANPAKIWKLSDDSEAFIELGDDYIRFGVGDQVSVILDREAMNTQAKSVNWQMDPSKMTYQGILTHIQSLAGLVPVGPKYNLDLDIMGLFTGIGQAVSSVRGATGF
jgi:hypothetical protein